MYFLMFYKPGCNCREWVSYLSILKSPHLQFISCSTKYSHQVKLWIFFWQCHLIFFIGEYGRQNSKMALLTFLFPVSMLLCNPFPYSKGKTVTHLKWIEYGKGEGINLNFKVAKVMKILNKLTFRLTKREIILDGPELIKWSLQKIYRSETQVVTSLSPPLCPPTPLSLSLSSHCPLSLPWIL